MDYKLRKEIDTYDITILGGGPAGASAAIRLCKAGLRVALFEKEIFPRPHVGESLVPFCYGLFEELDILDELEQTTVRKPGVKFVNKDGTNETTYCFKNIIDGPNQLSFNVRREVFDTIILNKAKQVGAHVYENHKVTKVHLTDKKRPVVSIQTPEGNVLDVPSKFVVDATGQNAFIARSLKVKEKNIDLDRTALVSHWNCSTDTNHFNEGILHIVYLSQNKNGWLWMVPVDKNRVGVGVVLDHAYIKESKKRYKTTQEKTWQEQFYLDEVLSSKHAKKILNNCEQLNGVTVAGNYSYTVEKKYGDNYVTIGDAAGFIDPIFATGIYLALNMSKQISNSLIEMFKNRNDHANKLLGEAFDRHEGALTLLRRFISNFYSADFVNLAEVGESNDSSDPEYGTKLIMFSLVHFLMGGDFYNESQKYIDYLKFLEQPKQLERYTHLVINQDKYKETTCEMPKEEVFPPVGISVESL